MRILFVCMGNICRSPTAEGVFRERLARLSVDLAADLAVDLAASDLQIEVDSAGTHDYHVGEPPDARSVAAALRRGIDLSTLRARLVDVQDFERFDLILAMDEQNLQELQRRAPSHTQGRLRLMMDYAPDAGRRFVPDPYYGGPPGFEEVLDLLEQAADGLLRTLLVRRP